ncbi:sortase-associated OmpA-like protein PdsO [Enterovibrio sp. ZSDZ35]|uniref:Sortase-associated OmpA-like protein PdsO n=1 Tax=Enterovibrio qingdaonensis TaxID=2899818 RepID=A0ABT5QF60_9GAMM|nr:sortase-associated OmpA-like protein PdsO [Enterovibrio sp. ZSDZ35]MDD1779606.1 sortase-associated OmpA-like protein PdsO [Enterovibrio sp. ZSDZ35]
MKNLNKTLIAISLVVPMVMSSAHATEQRVQQESDSNVGLIGFGGGAALGAVIGGPIGAVAGAVVGGLIGQVATFEEENKSQEMLISQMQDENHRLNSFKELYAENEIELATLKAAMQERNVELDLAMDIQFRTNSSEIEPHFQKQLDEVAFFMQQQPDVHWDLEGHADVRGNENYNLTLSQSRVQAVFDYLVDQGVDPVQLSATAYGDQLAIETDGDREGYFFDRRVSLRSVSGATETANH